MKKEEPRFIEANMRVRSMAQLDREMKEILEKQEQDRDMAQIMASGNVAAAGWSPKHKILGEDYDKLMEKKKLEDEDT